MFADEFVVCSNSNAHSFPIVDGIPILLDERQSIFSIRDVVARNSVFLAPKRTIRSLLVRAIPSLSKKIGAEENYHRLLGLAHEQNPHPQVLVVGGGEVGQGFEIFVADPSIDLVETDVSLGSRTGVICDAHVIPFDNESFEVVIAQAVLEHVVDPYRCVEEIHRVLKPHGLIYIETPFMIPVHFGRYDFTRFTQLGLRRLLRQFDQIEGGATGGPGMALAWSYRYFLISFTDKKVLRALLWAWSGMTSFFLKYFDYLLLDKRGALDGAANYYFIGRKEGNLLADRDLIALYNGAQS